MKNFAYILSKEAYHSLSDSHLWFSIFSCPSSSEFTRVQRCTCCFTLLCTAMLFDILYYKQMKGARETNQEYALSMGVFYFTVQEVRQDSNAIFFTPFEFFALVDHWCHRRSSLSYSEPSVGSVLSTDPREMWNIANTFFIQQAKSVQLDSSLVVSLYRLWIIFDHRRSIDRVCHCSWYRIT